MTTFLRELQGECERIEEEEEGRDDEEEEVTT
jgi:hypothetical protein